MANTGQKVPAETAQASLPSNLELLKKVKDLDLVDPVQQLKTVKKKIQAMSPRQREKLLYSIRQLTLK